MSTLKVLLKWAFATLVFAGILLGSAGRLDLPMVWAYLVVYCGSLLAWSLVTAHKDPALLEERRGVKAGTKGWDRVLLTIYGLLFLATWVVAGLDVGRFHWSGTVPVGFQIVGLIGFAAGLGLVSWATWANTFFSRSVRIQQERGHRVVTGGPYRYVRHPGYAMTLIGWPGTALALGSWWAMLPAVGIVLVYLVRTVLEDRTLHKELEGYAEYAQQVRYRWIPGVW